MRKIEKRGNRLLWISLLLFALVYVVIIGYYWFFGGYFGDSHLTISAYVGLRPWSAMLFCLTNITVAVLLVAYIYAGALSQKFLWRLLMMAFVVAFIGLSIAPRTPFASDSTPVHQFFSHSMFIIIALLALYAAIVSRSAPARWVATLVALYSLFFIVCYILNAPFLRNGILWFESAFVYSFFALIISSNHTARASKASAVSR